MTALVLSLLSLATAGAPGITVHIEGLRSARGTLRCALHNRAEAFPVDVTKAVSTTTAPAQVGGVVVHFDPPPVGDYAVACFHDENGNGKLDANFLGIPQEGVGSSNDAKGHFGPPKFADAQFHFAGTEAALTIHLQY